MNMAGFFRTYFDSCCRRPREPADWYSRRPQAILFAGDVSRMPPRRE